MSEKNSQIIHKIYEILSRLIMSDINEENTELETRLQDLGINSENYVKMGIELEEVFGITLTLQELDHQNNMFETVQSIVDFVTEKLSNEH